MINFILSLRNPFNSRFDIVSAKHFNVGRNKTLELVLYRCNVLVGIEFEISNFSRDHAGVRGSIQLAGYEATVEFYDNRHDADRN